MGKLAPIFRTVEVRPKVGEMVKPGEIIGTSGLESWSLTDRKIWNTLIHAAWGDRLDDPGAIFEIPMQRLRGAHDSNDRLVETLERLQKTLVRVRNPDGEVITVQLLGHTGVKPEHRAAGVLRYSFHPTLVPIIRGSAIYAKLDLAHMTGMKSKFSLGLYEVLCLKGNLRAKSEVVELDLLREWLGVEEGKLTRFVDLRRFAIDVAVKELEATPYRVTFEPIKRGRAVGAVRMTWQTVLTDPTNAGKVAKIESMPALPPFPENGIKYTPWEAIAREALPSPLPDLNTVAGEFVAWCKGKDADLAGPSIEKTFRTWCGKRGKAA